MSTKLNKKTIKNIFKLTNVTNFAFATLLISSPLITAVAPSNYKISNNFKSTAPDFAKEFKSTLEEEAKNTLENLESYESENFANFSGGQSEVTRLKNSSKFKSDFNNFIDKVKENPNLDLEKLAKSTLATKGIDFDKIKKQYDAKIKSSIASPTATNFQSRSLTFTEIITNNGPFGNLNLPWDPQKVSAQYIRIPDPKKDPLVKGFLDKLWASHVKSAVFAAINFGLAVAYGFTFNFVAAVSAGSSGGMLTYLAVEYKQAYNKLNQSTVDISNQVQNNLSSTNQVLGIIGSINKWVRSVLTIIGTVRRIQATVRPALVAASWASKVEIVIALIDVTQTLVSELTDRLGNFVK